VGRTVDAWRLLLAAALIGVLFLTLSWLQGRFDTSDHDKATKMVREYRAIPNGRTISDAIEARHPTAKDYDISWTSEIVSSCRGYVRVSAYVPPSTTYAFDVDLTGPSIHPTDPTTIEILKSLTATTATTAAKAAGG
jgi:hypothetical protein